MKAIILAAGRGSRMGGATSSKPKCLTRLSGQTLLEWQLIALKDAGLKDIAAVTGYRGDMLDGYVSHRFENDRWAETNMVRSLMCAGEWLSTSPCIVSYSDIFYTGDTVRALMQSGADIGISYDPDWLDLWSRRFDDPLSDAETFRLSETGTVTEIGKNTSSLQDIEGQYMGLLLFTPEGWGVVQHYLSALDAATLDKLDMTSLLSSLIHNGITIQSVAVRGAWGEVDSEADLRVYEDMISEGALAFPQKTP